MWGQCVDWVLEAAEEEEEDVEGFDLLMRVVHRFLAIEPLVRCMYAMPACSLSHVCVAGQRKCSASNMHAHAAGTGSASFVHMCLQWPCIEARFSHLHVQTAHS